MTKENKFHFFVDTIKYDTEKANLTGAEIKSFVADFNPAYQLYLESPGNEPDRAISDNETIPLDPAGHGVRKFYTVPPATFGSR
jgi:hypothetical protein